jgi:hypothetical protein
LSGRRRLDTCHGKAVRRILFCRRLHVLKGRYTEVQDLGVSTLREEDIGQLDVAMNYPFGMS